MESTEEEEKRLLLYRATDGPEARALAVSSRESGPPQKFASRRGGFRVIPHVKKAFVSLIVGATRKSGRPAIRSGGDGEHQGARTSKEDAK